MKFASHSFRRAAAAALALSLAAVAQAKLERAPAAPSPSHPPPASAPDAPYASDDRQRVGIFSNVHVAADEVAQGDVVSILGNAAVDGEARRDAVAVLGNLTVNGTVDRNAVAVLGNLIVNGTVRGDVVCPLGNITLGPNALVEGRVVCVLGALRRSPGAEVHGGTEFRRRGWGFGPRFGLPLLPFAFAPWWWPLSALCLAFYVLAGLAFPRALVRCGDQLSANPALVVLAAVLALVATPLLLLLLCLTIIGIPVAVGLVFGLILLVFFGKASIYGLIGRSFTRQRFGPALSVLIGGMLCLLIGLVPLLGFGLFLGLSLLGFGCAILAAFAAMRPSFERAAPAAGPPPAPAPSPAATETESATPPLLAATPPSACPEPAEKARPEPAEEPRAGFWIRMAALFIDSIIVNFAFSWAVTTTHIGGSFTIQNNPALLALAVYGAIMWKLKGATIGGMIFGLRVVRLDGRPMEWDTAVVRALGCFLSAAVMLLGFIWIAFDDEKQGWHDKIAGTLVLRIPKGTALV